MACETIWVSAEIVKGDVVRHSRSIYECSTDENMSDLFEKLGDDARGISLVARIFNSQTPDNKQVVPLNAPLRLLKEFACNSVVFEYPKVVDRENRSDKQPDAFAYMMKKSKEICLPKQRENRVATDGIYNEALDLLAKENVGWSKSIVDSVGVNFVKCLSDTLWHITSHFDFFSERGAKLSDIWYTYSNRHDFKKQKLAKPSLSSEKLKYHSTTLASFLNSTWMNSQRFSKVRTYVSSLNTSLIKVSNYMEEQKKKTDERRAASDPARISTENTTLSHISATTGPIRPEYEALLCELESREYYDPIILCDYEPTDRRERYKWLDNLTLPFNVALLRRAYGGNIGTMNFLWKVPTEEDERDDTTEMRVVLNLNNSLPNFHSRQMEKDFISRYSKLAKTPISVLRSIYHEISGDSSEFNKEQDKEINLRIAQFISSCDSSDIMIDLRKLNGRPSSTKYDEFWNEIQILFNEYQASVQERRQSNVLYLPFAISIRELVDRVKRRRPEIDVPSLEWVRLQFTPNNPYTNSAMKYTARFEIKFIVQRRQMRYDHPDSKYAQVTFKYLKEFAIKHKHLSRIIFLDDKAVVPVGNPGLPVSTDVRRHNKSLGPAKNAILAAADHDWNVCGIVSSVALCSEIPDNIGESFFNGKIMVTSKDRIFQPSTTIRHTREVANILQSNFSSNMMQLDEPILLMYTDGGGDHNVTHASVQLALLCLFLELNLDMLIAVRTCPQQSWTNPAERCMYLLNLALQNVALEREKMEDGFEKLIRNKTSMKEIRDKGKRNELLEGKFLKAMESPIKIVSERYESMCLKDEYVKTYDAATPESIIGIAKLIEEIDSNADAFTSTKSSLSSLTNFQDFYSKHCKASTYVFQVKKCTDSSCNFCLSHPIRMDVTDFQTLHYLPYPTLDSSKEHFEDFSTVYGKKTTEADRPSLSLKLQTTEDDLRFNSLLIANKVRDVIKCIDCVKSRCIYSGKALTPSMITAIQYIKDCNMYVCGSKLFPDSHNLHDKVIVKTTVSCEMPVEAAYYGATTIKLPNICNHCGGSSGSPFVDDDEFKELKSMYQRVRSYCVSCKNAGKEPTTWGAMGASAKKKQKKV